MSRPRTPTERLSGLEYWLNRAYTIGPTPSQYRGSARLGMLLALRGCRLIDQSQPGQGERLTRQQGERFPQCKAYKRGWRHGCDIYRLAHTKGDR